jgi:8-oxo-dGTP diphosphatase
MRKIVNAVLVRDDKVLLARRSPHRHSYPGLWSFPGGHVENTETLIGALLREVREEIGLVPTNFSFLVSIADPNASEHASFIYYFYAVFAWTGGEPALLGDEHTELRWFSTAAAMALPDLALDEYRSIFSSVIG